MRVPTAQSCAGGREYPLDIIVIATGFDALTGAAGERWRRSGRTARMAFLDSEGVEMNVG
jgi:hypothetical protein